MRVVASADLIDDREYAAPPELVFEAWTKAEHFARWFAPDGVDVTLSENRFLPSFTVSLFALSATGVIDLSVATNFAFFSVTTDSLPHGSSIVVGVTPILAFAT